MIFFDNQRLKTAKNRSKNAYFSRETTQICTTTIKKAHKSKKFGGKMTFLQRKSQKYVIQNKVQETWTVLNLSEPLKN